MIKKQAVYEQLRKLGINPKSWGASAISELPHVLTPHETIISLVNGWYENGFATLVATSERLLLIDKKWLHLTIEDIRYDMISEVDFNAQVVDSSICINTINKSLRFTSMKQRRLRNMTYAIQGKVMEARHQQSFSWQQFSQHPNHEQSQQTSMRFSDHQPDRQPDAHDAIGSKASLPLINPALAGMRRPTRRNHYSNSSLTTRKSFLPKVPRRLRPTAS